MRVYDTPSIRNVAIVGHSGSGKTQLTSAMLFNAGMVTRLGMVDEGTTVTDFDEEAIERKHTLSANLAYAEWNKTKINLIDTPGIENLRPNVSDIKEIENGFREINTLSERCKFRNCLHINEPDCAVKKALKQGKITIKRYDNYKKLIAEFQISQSF